MAIKTRSIDGDRFNQSEMTMDEFKKWLKRFDSNKDGRISQDELQGAIKFAGGWFSGRKSANGIQTADSNNDGYVDEHEMKNLVEFAQKHLGKKISS